MDNTRKRQAAKMFFALLLTIVSILLLSMIGDQVKYFSSKPFYKQPGLWTGIGLIGMVFFSSLYTLELWRSKSLLAKSKQSLLDELWLWVRSAEYLFWFMVYVLAVPLIGYLSATVLFGLLLTFRVGYNSQKIYISITLTTVAIVVIFKSLLLVKIPGGLVYEYFPDAIRNFLILNL